MKKKEPTEMQIKQLAFRIVGIHMDEAALEMFEMVHEAHKKKKGAFNLHDACAIRAKLHEKYGRRRVMYSMDLYD